MRGGWQRPAARLRIGAMSDRDASWIPFPTSDLLIDGRWRPGSTGETLALEDPSDGSELARIARGGADDVDAADRKSVV